MSPRHLGPRELKLLAERLRALVAAGPELDEELLRPFVEEILVEVSWQLEAHARRNAWQDPQTGREQTRSDNKP